MQGSTLAPSVNRNDLPGGNGSPRAIRPRRRRASLAVLGVLAVSLSGCTPLKEYIHNGFKVGPNYGRPPAPVAPDWIDAADARVRKTADDLSHWWTVFNDPVLDGLV